MSIEKSEDWGSGEGLFDLQCDGRGCTTSVEVEGYFDDVLAYLRDHHWRYFKEEGLWVHLCPSCSAAEDFA